MVKTGIIIQSRQTSKRLKNKVFKKIGKLSIIEHIYRRLKLLKGIDIVFAIPNTKSNNKLNSHLKKLKAKVYRGSENNVMQRYINASERYNIENIIRITGDCPFIDIDLIKKLITFFIRNKKYDYVSNILIPSFPDGFDIEIFKSSALKKAYKIVTKKFDKEHVTTILRRDKQFKKYNFRLKKDFSFIKLSVDTKSDLINLRKIYKEFNIEKNFSYSKIIKNKKINNLFMSQSTQKNFLKDKIKKSRKTWKLANKIIPGGNMLLSKNPDRFLPNYWPAYYKSAKGCEIIDYDNNSYFDLSTMGVGTNILGYAHQEVDNAVKKTINAGNMSSLNSYEEVELAEKLLDLHPTFEMAKFAKTGGEANAIAIRIARAASGKDKVAICGYHGWHDWYLAANLNNKSNKKDLDKHLIKGLNIKGVPNNLKNTIYPFEYGNYKMFDKVLSDNEIGIVKMEVCRNSLPDIKFLNYIRKKTSSKKIILIFDECTTGFRQTFGGLYKSIKIDPDMIILGKALGNGYPITSVLGKENIMKHANDSFISSTFWTERSSYSAALKTLEVMERLKSWKKITSLGKNIRHNWIKLFSEYGLKYDIKGIPALSSFEFKNNHKYYKALITQEMLKNNILASSTIYTSLSHTEKIVNLYFEILKDVVKKIYLCENGISIKKYLHAEVPLDNFQRLN